MKGFLILLPILSLGCASQQAGQLALISQKQLTVFQQNADAKVKQAEDARLELELRNLTTDVQKILSSPVADPNKTSQAIITEVQKKIKEHNDRLDVWATTAAGGAVVNTALGAIAHYNNTGVTLDDVATMISQIPVTPKPTPTPGVN